LYHHQPPSSESSWIEVDKKGCAQILFSIGYTSK
jgi:hypothetical protein